MKLESAFGIGQTVHIDGCTELRAVVTALSFTYYGLQIQVERIANGTPQSLWCSEWRLSAAEE